MCALALSRAMCSLCVIGANGMCYRVVSACYCCELPHMWVACVCSRLCYIDLCLCVCVGSGVLLVLVVYSVLPSVFYIMYVAGVCSLCVFYISLRIICLWALFLCVICRCSVCDALFR